MLNALQGFALWEKGVTIPVEGKITEYANPWTKQVYSDLQKLSTSSPCFALQWKEHGWWAIQTQEFLRSKVKQLESFEPYTDLLFQFTDKDVHCPHVDHRSFGSQVLSKTLPFPSSSASTMDTWMELPVVAKHKAEDLVDVRGKPTQKTRLGGKGKESKATQRDKLVDRALVNLDLRLRSVEDIVEDGLDAPADLEDVQAALAAGRDYQATVEEKGRGCKLGSPHTYTFSRLCKKQASLSDCPPELAEMIKAFVATYTTPAQIKHVVPFCTVHKKYGQNRAIITLHARSEIQKMWQQMRQFLVQRGAVDFGDTKPRGPIFKQLLQRVQI